MNVKAQLVEKVSSKTGKSYTILELTFDGDYKLTVFLNDDQLYILKTKK